MAAVGRVGSFGSSPPGLASTYASGPLANELASGTGGPAAGDDEDGQNLWSCILSEVSTRSRSKLPTGKNVLLLGRGFSSLCNFSGVLYHLVLMLGICAVL